MFLFWLTCILLITPYLFQSLKTRTIQSEINRLQIKSYVCSLIGCIGRDSLIGYKSRFLLRSLPKRAPWFNIKCTFFGFDAGDVSFNISFLKNVYHNFHVSGTVLRQLLPRKIAPNPKITLTQTLTVTMVLFSSGAIFWLPPTLKLTLTLTQTSILTGGAIFLGEQLYGYHLAQQISTVFGLKKRGGNISLLWTNCTYFGNDFSNLLVTEWKQIIFVFDFVFFWFCNHFCFLYFILFRAPVFYYCL